MAHPTNDQRGALQAFGEKLKGTGDVAKRAKRDWLLRVVIVVLLPMVNKIDTRLAVVETKLDLLLPPPRHGLLERSHPLYSSFGLPVGRLLQKGEKHGTADRRE